MIQLSPAQFDLGNTPLENMFIEEFLPYAPERALKVYILGLKLVLDGKKPDLKSLAERLDLSEDQVLEAYSYWEEQGLVKVIRKKLTTDVLYQSVRNLYLESNFERRTMQTSLDFNHHFQEIFKEVDQSLIVPLTEMERQQVASFLTGKKVDPEVVSMAYEEARTARLRTKKALEHLRYWLENGVQRLEDVLALKERLNLRQLNYKQVLTALGMPYDQPTIADKESIDRWLDEYHFTIEDILEKIKQITMNKRNPSLSYLESAFKNTFEGKERESASDEDISKLFRKRT